MKVETQALVPDAGEDRKRWTVLLSVRPGGGIQLNFEHDSGLVDPTAAVNEAIRKSVRYAHTFRAAVPGKTDYANGEAVHHPSVENGWLKITLFTEAGLELPDQARVRLQGHGGMRETSLEVAENLEELAQ